MDRFKRNSLITSGCWCIVAVFLFALYMLTEAVSVKYFLWATSVPILLSVLASLFKGQPEKSAVLSHWVIFLNWLIVGVCLQFIDTDAQNADTIVGESLQLTFWRNLDHIFLVLAALLAGTIVVGYKKNKKHSLHLVKGMLLGSKGTVINWQYGAGTIRLEPFKGRLWDTRPAREWSVKSSLSLSAGEQVRVVSADENLNNIEVEKLEDNKDEEQKTQNGFVAKWWHWVLFGVLQLIAVSAIPESFSSLAWMDHLYSIALATIFSALFVPPTSWFVKKTQKVDFSLKQQLILWMLYAAVIVFILG